MVAACPLSSRLTKDKGVDIIVGRLCSMCLSPCFPMLFPARVPCLPYLSQPLSQSNHQVAQRFSLLKVKVLGSTLNTHRMSVLLLPFSLPHSLARCCSTFAAVQSALLLCSPPHPHPTHLSTWLSSLSLSLLIHPIIDLIFSSPPRWLVPLIPPSDTAKCWQSLSPDAGLDLKCWLSAFCLHRCCLTC